MAITNLTNTTWKFNDTLNLTEEFYYHNLNIQSNGFSYDTLYCIYNGKNYVLVYGARNAYTSKTNTWYDGYQTITITGGSDVTNPDLISWLEANGTLVTSKAPNYTALDDALDRLAVAIAERTGAELPLTLEEMLAAAKEIGQAALISFTISGTSYQAEEGMTWEQWVNTDYNTNNKYSRGGGMSMYVEETANSNYYIYDITTNNCVLLEDIIEANATYATKYVDPVGGSD